MRYDRTPSLDDLKSEIRSRELYGLFALFGFLPMVTMPADLSADSSIETMTDKDMHYKKFVKIFANPTLQEFFKYGLKRFEQLGVFNEI